MNTNGNAYQEGRAPARGPAAASSSGTRSRLTFDPPGVPTFVRPEMVPTRSVEGRNGPQYMWMFEGAGIAWFDPDFHQELCACIETSGAAELAITKHVRKGQPPRFEVQPVAEVDEQPQPPVTPRSWPRSRGEAKANVPAVAARRIQEVKARAPQHNHEEANERETAPPCNSMAAALMEAMLAVHEVIAIATAHGVPWKPSSEDIRALAITIYINQNGGRK
jgi:hypothetical protein